MDEAESVLSSRSASPYSQMHAGNSSPAAEIEKPPSSSQNVNHSKSVYQNVINNRPIAPSVPKCTTPSTQYARINNEQNINATQSDSPHLDQQDIYSSSAQNAVPTPYTHSPATVNNAKVTDISHLAVNTTTHSIPTFSDSNVAVFHIPSHLATAMSTAGLHATDVVGLANADSLASVGHITNSWDSSTSIPLLDADFFNNSKHGVFNTNPNAVNQRTVSFAGAGYATGSIGQSVE